MTNFFNDTLNALKGSELGKKTEYDPHYNPDHLFAIPRAGKRLELDLDPTALPFFGFDYWNHYEVSWLNEKGKPIVALAEFYYDCHSPKLIESKSLKLYFNSLNNTRFKSTEEVKNLIQADLEKATQAAVFILLHPLNNTVPTSLARSFSGLCLDTLDIECTTYTVDSSLLSVESEYCEETLHSNLLKSNCLITNQPDWGSVQIHYKGTKINHANLLRYLVSFRNHNEFHEQCIERIFTDLIRHCQPTELTVYGRYTRRGGLDINPYRSTLNAPPTSKTNLRLARQ